MGLFIRERFLPRPFVKIDTLPLPSLAFAREKIVDEHRAEIGKNPSRLVTFASADHLYASAVFGRDSAQMGLDSVEKAKNLFHALDKTKNKLTPFQYSSLKESAEHFQELSHDICLVLAQLQGTTLNKITGEEPGKIHHEYRDTHLTRNAFLEGKITQDQYQEQLHIIDEMSNIFAGRKREVPHKDGTNAIEQSFTIYFSNDATPIFLKLVYAHLGTLTEEQQKDFLQETYINKDGNPQTMRDAIEKATDWIAQTIQKGPLLTQDSNPPTVDHPHLLSWQHTNRFHQQILEDSQESWYHEDGSPTNEFAPRMATEVQGMVYDALKHGAKLLQKPEYMQLARSVQNDVVDMLWMEDVGYFAQGLDISPKTKKYQPIKILSLTSSDLLDSDIVTDLPRRKRRQIIKGITSMLWSDEFKTSYGQRTQAKRHASVFEIDGKQFSPYHGPETSWLVLQGRLIKGLEKVGLNGIANEVRAKLLNTAMLIGSYVEFVNVTKNGVLGNNASWGIAAHSNGQPVKIYTTNHQEALQGWTYTAVEREVDKVNRRRILPTIPFSWQYRLENALRGKKGIRRIVPTKQEVQVFQSAADIHNARQQTYVAKVDVAEGRRLQRILFEKWHVTDDFQLTNEGVATK